MPRVKKSKVLKVEEKVEEKVDGSFRPEKPKRDKKDKKDKPKRKPSAYAQFVRDHYKDGDVQALVPKMRFALIAKKWKEHKAKSTK